MASDRTGKTALEDEKPAPSEYCATCVLHEDQLIRLNGTVRSEGAHCLVG